MTSMLLIVRVGAMLHAVEGLRGGRRKRLQMAFLVGFAVVYVAILLVALLGFPQADTQSADRNEFVRACGYKLPTERFNRVYVRGMRKDCGIFGSEEGSARPRPAEAD